jgi:hypothetical protein
MLQPEPQKGYSPVEHVHEIEDAVEYGHEQIGHAQIHQEVVSNCAHPSVRCSTKQMSVKVNLHCELV